MCGEKSNDNFESKKNFQIAKIGVLLNLVVILIYILILLANSLSSNLCIDGNCAEGFRKFILIFVFVLLPSLFTLGPTVFELIILMNIKEKGRVLKILAIIISIINLLFVIVFKSFIMTLNKSETLYYLLTIVSILNFIGCVISFIKDRCKGRTN